MGIFTKSKPKESKRGIGFGVVLVSPYLFKEPKAFFDELKKKVLPYLSKEEEEEILNRVVENKRGIKALVPKDIYRKVEENKIVMNTAEIVSAADIHEQCFCGSLWTNGCCGGVAMGRSMASLLYKYQDDMDGDGDELKDGLFADYFILRPTDMTDEDEEDLD